MFKYLKGKKILTIIPHEDDELNLIGGLLNSNYIDKDKLYIAYVTNGDYYCKTATRVKEVTRVLKKCKVNQNNIIFLGYSDQHFSETNHIYMTSKKNKFISKNNQTETYFFNNKNEFPYQKRKKHSEFNKESLIEDLELLIIEIMPDIIFVNDFDSHPDHRCTSLCFDYAIEKVLKKHKNYYPEIFKGFCYPTSYNGYNDYDNINMLSTRFKKEENNEFEFQNPYYFWNERIRFPVGKSIRKYLLLKNKLYQELLEHKSQLILRRYKSIINSDQIFWKRRTDNLCLTAKIDTTSGKSNFLNDYITFDCEDIMHKDISFPKYKNVAWIPSENDNLKKITIKLEKPSYLEEIKFYQNSMSKGKITDIIIKYNNKISQNIKLKDKLYDTVKVNLKEIISQIEIEIISRQSINAGFTEIEIFSKKEYKIEFLKILVNDNFAYDKYYINKNDYKIGIYCYNGNENINVSKEDLIYSVNGKEINYKEIKTFMKKSKYTLKVSLKDNPEIYDRVEFRKITYIDKIIFYLSKKINSITLVTDIFFSRVHNKIKRLLKLM